MVVGMVVCALALGLGCATYQHTTTGHAVTPELLRALAEASRQYEVDWAAVATMLETRDSKRAIGFGGSVVKGTLGVETQVAADGSITNSGRGDGTVTTPNTLKDAMQFVGTVYAGRAAELEAEAKVEAAKPQPAPIVLPTLPELPGVTSTP